MHKFTWIKLYFVILNILLVYYCNIQTQLMFTKDLQLKAFSEASLPSIAMTTVRRFLVLAVAMVHVIQVVCSQLK